MGPSVAELLAEAAECLRPVSQSPGLDAELLLCQALERPRSFLHAWPEHRPPDSRTKAFNAILRRRIAGEPMAYITGVREFWSLTLKVGPEVLIPRPDTETLVEQALARMPREAALRVADLGTGSGAIALAIASERPRAQVMASDVSPAALDRARDNARRCGLAVMFLPGDWFEALREQPPLHLIVSNPPYVAAADPHLKGDLLAEPKGALVSGTTGMEAIRHIVAGAAGHLLPGGWLLLEHGWDQGAATRDLLSRAGFRSVSTTRDLSGLERVSAGRRPANPGGHRVD
jgi:release factor glutamine methyltransferase